MQNRTLGLYFFLCFSACMALPSITGCDGHPPDTHTAPTQNTLSAEHEKFLTWLQDYLHERPWKKHPPAPTQLNRETLEKSLDLMIQFIINNQQEAGNFHYQYDFVQKTLDPNDSQVRQAGTLWGLSIAYHYKQEEKIQKAIDKALSFFFSHTKKGLQEGTLFIAYPGTTTCSTGTVALVSLAIIEYLRTEKEGKIQLEKTYRKTLTDHLRGYIAHLKFMRFQNAHFSKSYHILSRKQAKSFSPYFDGETLLCFVKAAKYLDYRELIPLIEESAHTMAKYYTRDQWIHEPDSNLTKGFFQWSCMAFWEYQDAGWKNASVFGDYVLALSWWMIHTHRTLQRRRNTAYAYEGIIPAYQLAQTRHHQRALHDLSYTIDQALYKLTSWQVGGPLQAENLFLTENPTQDPLAIGGIMNHKKEPFLRIDVAQHQMHAVILSLKYVYK